MIPNLKSLYISARNQMEAHRWLYKAYGAPLSRVMGRLYGEQMRCYRRVLRQMR